MGCRVDRIERLLGSGYFPAQLPPCFTTQKLADHHATLYAEWLALQPNPSKGTKVPKAPSSRAELFSVARAGHLRRITSLTNPVAQTFLSTHLIQHWADVLKHYRRSRLSASKPRFLANGARAANIPSMRLLYERKIRQSAGYRYMLRTDVSRFFPTIYTHSVPWAFHGKAIAKKNRKVTSKFFGNLLDLSLRQGQEEQTIGLPIGPDTSHMIAEAIATSVDIELKKRLKASPAGFRYVDDYFMFFSTANEAEAALAALVRSLKEFELQINFEKTKTCSVVEITDDYWPHQLRSFQIDKAASRQTSDIHHFFELAKDLARRNSDENVMTYALKRASSVLVRKENWDCFEAHVCHVALAYPNTLQMVARLLSTYAHVGYPLRHDRLERLVNAIVQDHAPLGHHSEVAWGLWMCKDLNLKLHEANIDVVAEMHSSVCALLLLDLDAAGALVKTPKSTYWKQFETKESLHGDLWLLSYEAGMRGWGGFTQAHILADPHFDLLRVKNIHFYDNAAKLSPVFHVKPEALEFKSLFDISAFFDLADADDFIEFDDGESGYDDASIADKVDDDIGQDEDEDDEEDAEDEPYM